MTDTELAELDAMKKQTALLLEEKAKREEEKAKREEQLIEKIIAKLESIERELQIVRSSTTELPQLRANQESQAVRIRTLEDRWIIVVAMWIITVLGFVAYIKWRLT